MIVRRFAAGTALLALVACKSEPAKTTSSPPAPSATATTTALTAGLRLDVTAVPAAAGPDAVELTLTVVNTTSAPIHGAWFRPLIYGLDATDPSGARIPIVIPPTDMPVERVELTLAPGEAKKLPSPVTLWFDASGKPRSSMFDWVVQAKRAPIFLSVRVDLEVGDAGQVSLRASTRT
jgi:hypothetical protein